MSFLPYAVPFFLLLIVLEIFWGWKKGDNTYRINDCVNSLSLGLLSTVTKFVFLNIGLLVFSRVEQEYALLTLNVESTVDWVIGLIIYDFFYYWFHRISHERQIFWGSHVVHHQSEDYNLSTALRQTSTGFLATWVFFVPCFFFGMPIYMYVGIASAHLIYQFWIHTQHIPKLGIFEWAFVTPSNHRVHHAQNPKYIDKNYGGLLIVWDRIFGTFIEEDENEEILYGLRTPLLSWSPLWANVHVFVNMFVDARRAKSRADKVKMIWSRTGWRPEDVAQKFPVQKTDLNNFIKYSPPIAQAAGVAIVLQYLLLTVFHLWSVVQYSAVTYPVILGLSIFQIYTVISLGAVMEGKKYLFGIELSRVLVLSAITSYLFFAAEIDDSWFYSGMAWISFSAVLMWLSISKPESDNDAVAATN